MSRDAWSEKMARALQFDVWCDFADIVVGKHRLFLIDGDPAKLSEGVSETAAILPGHYASEKHIARVFDRLRKAAAAKLIRQKLPTSKTMRSGDLGEIFATEWINSHSGGYFAPVKRLRWKDHRDLAMRGEDVIAIRKDPQSGWLQFLKTEAKSRAMLSSSVIADARDGLDKDMGLPSAHALAFISARLIEIGDCELADAIDDALLKFCISPQDVRHLMFVLSGSNPERMLTTSLKNYKGTIPQWGVGLRINDHVKFVGTVYDQVIANGDND
ncbi:MAG: SAVED domain-containing protein [Rhodobacteraceae bacterium]|nr:SAVED domain-containing protein [Paracoccaceae bacterium]